MTVHDEARGGFCGQPRCRNAALQEASKAFARRIQEEKERLFREALAWRARIAKRHALGEIAAVVPSNELRLTRLPARRREIFAEKLAELVRDALTTRSKREPAPEPDEPKGVEKTLLAAGCATCRGSCCTRGGEHAYMRVETLQRFMDDQGTCDVGTIVRAYCNHLPAVTYRDSCVFHGRQGCALPREMRSAICNNFYCGAIKDFLHDLRAAPGGRSLVVAAGGGHFRRAAIVDDGGIRTSLRPPPEVSSPAVREKGQARRR